jgi:hypothetical protein
VFAPRSDPGELPEKEDREMGIATDVVTVLHPAAEDVAEPQCLAPRLSSLEGRTVGLIDNHKRNANVYLAALGRLLQDRYGVSHVVQAAHIRAEALGLPEHPVVVIEHPLASKTPAQAQHLAYQSVEAVVRALVAHREEAPHG